MDGLVDDEVGLFTEAVCEGIRNVLKGVSANWVPSSRISKVFCRPGCYKEIREIPHKLTTSQSLDERQLFTFCNVTLARGK